MFSSLVRWFGRESSGRGSGSARRFTPQVETLEERTTPGGTPAGVANIVSGAAALLGAKVAGPSHVTLFGSKAAGAGDGIFGLAFTISRSSGEELPQQ